MARNDIKVITPTSQLIEVKWLVAAGASAFYRGEPTIMSSTTGTTDGLVKVAADADPTTAANHRFAGVAKSDSTQTASVAGSAQVWLPLPGVVYAAKAKTATAADTQAEIDALKGARVILDLTSTTWSVDTGATDAAANGIIIIGGDPNTSTVHFVVSPGVTIFNTQN